VAVVDVLAGTVIAGSEAEYSPVEGEEIRCGPGRLEVAAAGRPARLVWAAGNWIEQETRVVEWEVEPWSDAERLTGVVHGEVVVVDSASGEERGRGPVVAELREAVAGTDPADPTRPSLRAAIGPGDMVLACTTPGEVASPVLCG